MASPAHIAQTLLTATTDPHLAEMLFEKSEHVSNRVGSLLSERAAMRAYKGPIAKVISIASDPGTSPKVLAKFIKDTRVSVRLALLSNPSTPYEAISSIISWLMERSERNEAEVLFTRLEAAEIVLALEAVPPSYRERASNESFWGWIPARLVAEKLTASDSATLLKVAAMGYPTVSAELALNAHLGKINSQLTDILEATNERHRAFSISYVCSKANLLTVELAKLALQQPSARPGKPAFIMVEQGALEILVLHPNHDLFAAALRLGVSNLQIGTVIPGLDQSRMEEMLDPENGMVPGRLNAEQEVALVERYLTKREGRDSAQIDSLAVKILALLGNPLPRKLALRFITNVGYSVIPFWLSEKSIERPRSGEVLQVFKSMESTKRDNIWLFRVDLANGAGKAWEEDAAQLLDDRIASLADPVFADFTVARITARIGNHLQAWDTLIGLAQDWDQGLTSLLDATVAFCPDSVLKDEVVKLEQSTLFSI